MSKLNEMTTKMENDSTIVFEREFDAPVGLVFEMFKKAEHIKQWWAPNGFEIPFCTIDFRPGGIWHYCMKCTDKSLGSFYGTENWAKATYNEISEPNHIQYSHHFSDADGSILEDMPTQELTLDFIDLNGKTKLINKAAFANASELEAMAPMMEEGILQSWERLAELL